MRLSDFEFSLDKSFIAQFPAVPRDSSKLMVYDSANDRVIHTVFSKIGDFLAGNDVLVLNSSKVVPARISFGGKELFLLKRLSKGSFEVFVRPGRFFKVGKEFMIDEKLGCKVLAINDDGTRVVDFAFPGDLDEYLRKVGKMPFPPYVENKGIRDEQYQTVYADIEGSTAAPTAGLHFTPELISDLRHRGINFEHVILHVGRGTFLPITAQKIEDHLMHEEFFQMSPSVAELLNESVAHGRRLIAVGTTSVRVLESCYTDKYVSGSGETQIFIYPGNHAWSPISGLITNFHLPKSTLLLLVASFLEKKGVNDSTKKLLGLYELAKKEGYRFYSFGDAMFIF